MSDVLTSCCGSINDLSFRPSGFISKTESNPASKPISAFAPGLEFWPDLNVFFAFEDFKEDFDILPVTWLRASIADKAQSAS